MPEHRNDRLKKIRAAAAKFKGQILIDSDDVTFLVDEIDRLDQIAAAPKTVAVGTARGDANLVAAARTLARDLSVANVANAISLLRMLADRVEATVAVERFQLDDVASAEGATFGPHAGFRLKVPSGVIVEIQYGHNPSNQMQGPYNFVQIRDHGQSFGIDRRGDVIDVLEREAGSLRDVLADALREIADGEQRTGDSTT